MSDEEPVALDFPADKAEIDLKELPAAERCFAATSASVTIWAKPSAEGAAEEVVRLLREGSHLEARDTALQAARRFPGNARLARLAGFFDPKAKARISPASARQPDRTKDFAWLDRPPAWAHGKWVALVGGKVVAWAESLDAVSHALDAIKPITPPLVHRIE